ncbi:hypothetical protein D3C80_1939200 [compost metagenome]
MSLEKGKNLGHQNSADSDHFTCNSLGDTPQRLQPSHDLCWNPQCQTLDQNVVEPLLRVLCIQQSQLKSTLLPC